MAFFPTTPLASGLLSGKYRKEAPLPDGRITRNPNLAQKLLTEENWQRIETLRGFAEARGRSLLDLAMSWLAQQPRVSSIAGATRPEQVEANVRAVDGHLSPQEQGELRKLLG